MPGRFGSPDASMRRARVRLPTIHAGAGRTAGRAPMSEAAATAGSGT